jgi:hypothetical protein
MEHSFLTFGSRIWLHEKLSQVLFVSHFFYLTYAICGRVFIGALIHFVRRDVMDLEADILPLF